MGMYNDLNGMLGNINDVHVLAIMAFFHFGCLPDR